PRRLGAAAGRGGGQRGVGGALPALRLLLAVPGGGGAADRGALGADRLAALAGRSLGRRGLGGGGAAVRRGALGGALRRGPPRGAVLGGSPLGLGAPLLRLGARLGPGGPAGGLGREHVVGRGQAGAHPLGAGAAARRGALGPLLPLGRGRA